MNTKRPRGFVLALLAGASLLATAAITNADSNNGTLALEWDAAPPEDNVASYVVEAKVETNGLLSWEVVGTQPPTATTFTVTGLDPANGPTEYRLKIVNVEGNFVVSPNTVTDYPTADLNFRQKAEPTGAHILIDPEKLTAAADASLAEFRVAIHAPDPEPLTFCMFEAFLASQSRGETPFRRPPSRETGAARRPLHGQLTSRDRLIPIQ